MAKRISDEEIRLNVVINGDTAQKELYEQEKRVRELNAAQKELRKEKQLLEKQGKKDSDQYRAVTAAIKENTAEINKGKARIQELQQQIGLTGLTMNQLRSEALRLKLTLNNLVPGSEDYKRYEEDLKKVNDRMGELRGQGQQAKWSIAGLADGFNRYAALGASVIAAGTGVVLSIQKILDMNGKLADSQTNVMKTTGMTKKEVDELTKSFGMLKTRTGRIELLGIAEVGGRLGIAKAEIADFVKVMDKSAVALGDSFEGGPEVVAEKLGRIKGLYDELKNAGVEEAFESVGSALNDLGADGTASEQNVAEFVQRVGRMPGDLKPSIQTALGLGAAFEEGGLKAEVAATNYSKVVSIAARDTAAFAKVMGRPVAELEKLINTNPTEFFLQFSQSLKGLDATDLAKVLDYLKLNDNEVKMVLGAASDNVDLFRDKIKLAGESMADATSLTEEYNLKNNNLQATLERLKKKVVGWFTSDSVVAFITSGIEKFAKFIGAVEDSDGTMTGLRNTLVFTAKVFAILVTGLVSYTTATKLATLWSDNLKKSVALSNIIFRIQYAQLVIQETATKALALAKALLSGNIIRVRTAYQALSVAMGANPFGALLAVIGAVIAAFVVFRDKTTEANGVIKAHAEVQKQVADQTAKTKQKVSDLVAVLKDELATDKQKEDALKRLKEIGGGYLEMLTKENILTSEGDRLVKRYIQSIDNLARAKAIATVKGKLYEQQLEADNKITALSIEKKANKNGSNSFWLGDDGKLFGLQVGDRNQTIIQDEIKDAIEQRDQIKFQIEAIDKTRQEQIDKYRASIASQTKKLESLKKDSLEYKDLALDIKNNQDALNILVGLTDADTDVTPARGGGGYIPDPEKDKAAKEAEEKAEKLRKERAESIKKQLEELTELERQAIDEKLALLLEGNDKEAALENERHKRRVEDLQKMMISDADIIGAYDKMLNAKTKEEESFWLEQISLWEGKNQHLNNLLESEDRRHQFVMSTQAEKAETKRIQDLQAAYERQGVIRQAMHNNALAALGNNEKAKQELQKQFDADELVRQQRHLEKLIDEKERILQGLNSNINLKLLTPEQQREIKDQIDQLYLKLSELSKAKSELQDAPQETFGSAARQAFGDADILGFTPDQWEQTYANLDTLAQKLQMGSMVVQGLQNIWSAYNDFVAAGENRQLSNFEKSADKKKKKLKWQLDNGYISQSQYQKQLEQMDAELEKKRAEIEYKQAKRQKTAALFEATVNTAKGVTAAIPNIFLMALAAAAGALQIATIAKTSLPARGYEEGLYPEAVVKREQDGKLYNARYGGRTRSGLVRRPTYFLAGENGPEMVIDAQAYRQMSPGTRDLLIRELRGIKGFEKGRYNTDITGQPRYELPAGPAPSGGSAAEILLEKALVVISENTAVMRELRENGVSAWIARDYRNYKDLQEDLDKLKASRDKAQQ